MSIRKLLTEEIDNFVSGNTIYLDNEQRWQYLFESYIGGEAYREGNHLTRYQLETDGEYTARLLATPLDNHCQSVVSVYNSFLFREQPRREYGSIENIPEVTAFLEDADLDGRSLNAFMKDVSTWTSVFGHAWILMAKPNTNANTRAEELNQGIRPYVNLITPLMMLDWSYSRSASGAYQLDYVKYIEEINGSIRTIKEWTPELIKTTVVDVDNSTVNEEVEEINGLGLIPAVCVYNKKSTVRGLGVSDLADISDSQRMIYNLNSEIEQGIRLDGHPSLVTTPNTNVGSGAGAVIHMSEDLDPALKPYVLDHGGSNIDSILKTKQAIVENIDKMANTGAVRATESRTMSGVAMETEFALLNARLSEKADNLELCEESLWRLFAVYQGYIWDGMVDYPDSFGIKDVANDIRLMLETRKTVTNPKLIDLLEYEIAESHFGEDALEDYEMDHPTLTEENRQPHIEAMIMEGYTDQQILELHPELSAELLQAAKAVLLNRGE